MQKNILRIVVWVVILLLIPVFGNLFIDGWNWDFFDFVVWGLFLFFVGLLIDFSLRKIAKPEYKILAVLAIVGGALLVWTELSVQAVSRTLGL